MKTNRTIPWKSVAAVCAFWLGALGAAGAQESPPAEAAGASTGLRLNFRGAPLDEVLDYLSREAGFIINREADIQGVVDVWSYQPLSPDEAVILLNTVLNGKGYAAVRNERVLTIVTREEARKRSLPVHAGSDPEEIPRTDEMVTQIIPVRHAGVEQLLENLTPLLESYAVASVNESSNAIVLTDTQANIRRITEIVQALDTSITSISDLKVFMLQHSEAESVAELVNSLFETEDSDSRSGPSMPRFFGGPRGGPMGGGDNQSTDAQSAALKAVSRVTAVGDERTNALVVAAPDELMPTISELVAKIDTVAEAPREVRVFTMEYADAEEMAELITDLFEESGSTTSSYTSRSTSTGSSSTNSSQSSSSSSSGMSLDR